MKNLTTGQDAWCIQGTWVAWAQMTPAQRLAKLAFKANIAEMCQHSQEATQWKKLFCASIEFKLSLDAAIRIGYTVH